MIDTIRRRADTGALRGEVMELLVEQWEEIRGMPE